jgi:hypothetical protein
MTAYHDRVNLLDNFEIVHAHETIFRQWTYFPVNTPWSPQKGRTTWTQGESWVPEESFEFALDPHGDWYDEQVEAPVTETLEIPVRSTAKKKSKKKSKVLVRSDPLHAYRHLINVIPQRQPNVFWKENFQLLYLDEMIRWEGRGDVMGETDCRECCARVSLRPGVPEYRCLDCFLPDLTCHDCCVKRHRMHPLHVIEVGTLK